jgi:hypothetical protein
MAGRRRPEALPDGPLREIDLDLREFNRFDARLRAARGAVR